MSKKPFKPKHLELRYKTYFALLVVPKDVRDILGRSKFFETTGTGDLAIAQPLANLKIIKWKSEIAIARTKSNDPSINSAIELNRLRLTNNSPGHLISDVIEEERFKINDKKGKIAADAFKSIATGKSKPLIKFIDQWVSSEREKGLQEKTIAQYKSDLELLTTYLPTLDLLIFENINNWIKNLAKIGNFSPSSVTRIIASCRNFFNHLKYIGEIPEDAKVPFVIPIEFKKSKKSKARNKTEPWLPFESDEVENLYQEAVNKNDWTLGQLILIGAYTGARIEEICSLKKENINLKNESIKIENAKTEAGNRIIPIHKDIVPVIQFMLMNDDSYLIEKLTLSKYQDRSNAIGKRFGRLKNTLGFSKRYVFHSIRKTFTTKMADASVPEFITADIVGHEIQTMTYGLYKGDTSLDVKKDAINKISYNFPQIPTKKTVRPIKSVKKSTKTRTGTTKH